MSLPLPILPSSPAPRPPSERPWGKMPPAAEAVAGHGVKATATASPDEKETASRAAEYVTLAQIFEAQANRTSDRPAVESGGAWLTYAELNRRANQLAHFLRRQGVHGEAPVGVCLRRSLMLPVALLGILKAGGACMPLDPSYPADRLAYMVGDAQPVFLLTDSSLRGTCDQVGTKVFALDRLPLESESADSPSCCSSREQAAYVLYTSGSTGKPRGVVLPHRGLVNHCMAARELYGLTEADRVLQFSSISFDIAIEEMYPSWAGGAAVVLRRDDMSLAAGDFLQWIDVQQITVLDLPTAFWHELVRQMEDGVKQVPPSLRLVILGGETMSANAFRSWRRIVGPEVRVINTYGPTEASVIVTAREMGEDGPATSIGRPVANAKLYILDHDLKPVLPGARGELYIGGIGLARGYLNAPQATAEKFIPDPFSGDPEARMYKTGDQARLAADGELEFLGRLDFQVKIRGFRVELAEIESALLQHPEVREAVVIVMESGGGKRLVAYIIPLTRTKPDAGSLRQHLSARLPEYMIPADFVAVDAFPLSPNHKVDRSALAKLEQGEVLRSGASLRPRDALEVRLLELWEDVLGIKRIGIRDNFWELGGHSLLAARLMHKLEQAFGRKLPLATLLQAPTVADLGEVLRLDRWRPEWFSLVPIQAQGSRHPFFCVHGIGGNVVGFRALAQYIGKEQPFYGLQAQGLDGVQACHTRVPDMAAHYSRELRTVQPRGPYFLGGFSFGGWVALEMAQQLCAQGEQVGIVALLDTYPRHLQSFSASVKSMLAPGNRQQLITVLPNSVFKVIRRKIIWISLPRVLRNVQNACTAAEQDHRVSPYNGRVALFRASTKLFRGCDDQAEGWRKLACGGFELYEIPGQHGDIILEPGVKVLAKKLRECLVNAQAHYGASAVAP